MRNGRTRRGGSDTGVEHVRLRREDGRSGSLVGHIACGSLPTVPSSHRSLHQGQCNGYVSKEKTLPHTVDALQLILDALPRGGGATRCGRAAPQDGATLMWNGFGFALIGDTIRLTRLTQGAQQSRALHQDLAQPHRELLQCRQRPPRIHEFDGALRSVCFDEVTHNSTKYDAPQCCLLCKL